MCEMQKFGNKEMGTIWRLRSSGTLRSLDWQLVTDVSGQPIGPVFFGEAFQEETFVTNHSATWHPQNRGDPFYIAMEAWCHADGTICSPGSGRLLFRPGKCLVVEDVWYVYTVCLSQPLHLTANCRCDDTRCCIIQFWPPDDEHIVLEACRGI